jgi:hypothetical protein
VKSIDPTTTNPNNAPIISVKQQVYVSDQPGESKQFMPTQDMATAKQIEEKNYLLIV